MNGSGAPHYRWADDLPSVGRFCETSVAAPVLC